MSAEKNVHYTLVKNVAIGARTNLNNHIRDNHSLIQSTMESKHFHIFLKEFNRILMILSLMTKVTSKLKNQMTIIQRMLKNYS